MKSTENISWQTGLVLILFPWISLDWMQDWCNFSPFSPGTETYFPQPKHSVPSTAYCYYSSQVMETIMTKGSSVIFIFITCLWLMAILWIFIINIWPVQYQTGGHWEKSENEILIDYQRRSSSLQFNAKYVAIRQKLKKLWPFINT